MEFKFTDGNKRYHTLSYHNKKVYNKKIFKAVIDAGFTCPNKDGSKGFGGCIFCRGGSGYFTGAPELSVSRQLEAEIKRIRQKHESCEILAYFQANTNTYAPLAKLKSIYLPVAQNKDIFGISIGTRADCITYETAHFLKDLSEMTNLTVELGMQSAHNSTLLKINSGFTFDEFLKGYQLLKSKGIRVCLHIINGLPDETADMMLDTAKKIAFLHPDAVKIQLLHILKDTPLEKLYLKGQIMTLSREKYVQITVDQLEIIPPEIVVERITGDGDKKYLVAPLWSKNKIAVLNEIDKELFRRNSFQGKFFVNNP